MILNGKLINPGEFNTKIMLEKRVKSVDAGGFPVITVEQKGFWWCKWINVHGGEVWAASQAGVEAGATVLMRFHAQLDATWSVNLDGQTWEIVGQPDDIMIRHEYMEFKVRRMAGG